MHPGCARWQLDEAGALRLAEGHGYVKVHRDPTVNGHDQIIAPHGYASLHEQKVKVPHPSPCVGGLCALA